jgi:hypothetical protein
MDIPLRAVESATLNITIGDSLQVLEDMMARKVVFVSDLTGKEIDERNAAKVTISYADARRGQIVLDVNANEVDDLAAKGVKQARRGRKPKATV